MDASGGSVVEKPSCPPASAQLTLQENPESSVTAPVIPLGYFPASEKVHFKVSISSDSARGKSPKFHLISHISSVSYDDGKCSWLQEKPSAKSGRQVLLTVWVTMDKLPVLQPQGTLGQKLNQKSPRSRDLLVAGSDFSLPASSTMHIKQLRKKCL